MNLQLLLTMKHIAANEIFNRLNQTPNQTQQSYRRNEVIIEIRIQDYLESLRALETT